LIVAGVVLPPLVWFGGGAWIEARAAFDPTPDQGAMVLVYLSFWAAVAVGLVLSVAGLILLVRRAPAAKTQT
jgi:hypothetical protein